MTFDLPIKETSTVTCPNCESKVLVQVLIQDLEHVSSDERSMEQQINMSSQRMFNVLILIVNMNGKFKEKFGSIL